MHGNEVKDQNNKNIYDVCGDSMQDSGCGWFHGSDGPPDRNIAPASVWALSKLDRVGKKLIAHL